MPNLAISTRLGSYSSVAGALGDFPVEVYFKDAFTTNQAAPLAGTRTAEPGPGTVTITDTGNRVSIAGSQLVQTTGSSSYTDPALRTDNTWLMVPGICTMIEYVTKAPEAASYPLYFGDTIGMPLWGYYNASNSVQVRVGQAAAGAIYRTTQIARGYWGVVMLDAGCLFVCKTNATGYWEVAFRTWQLTGIGNTYFSAISNRSNNQTYDNWIVGQLPGPFFTAAKTFMNYEVAGNVTEGTTFTHQADCQINFIYRAAPAVGTPIILRSRIQDADNCWELQIDSTNTMTLYERVGGVNTSRGTSALLMNQRVYMLWRDIYVHVLRDNTPAFNYQTASSFKTATQTEVTALGGTGRIDDLNLYNRRMPSFPASLLDKLVA